MNHFCITDPKGNIISQNLTETCQSCFSRCSTKGSSINDCPIYNENRRQGKVVTNNGVTFLCDTTKTTRLFRDKLEGLSYAFPDLIIAKNEIEEKIRKTEQQKVNRLVHNLSSINAHNIQEIYDLVSQEVLSANWKQQIDFIEKEIKGNPKKASLMFLRIAKNSIHMKSEFSIYRKLDREDKTALEIRPYPIRTVLLNVLHTFFGDFSNNGIYVDVTDFFGKVKIDYETIQVAIYHLIENATKYAKHQSNIEVTFNDLSLNHLYVHFSMKSAYVDPSERDIIFNEGISGSMARKMKKSGDGIGMWRIKQMMTLNGGDFSATFGDKKESIGGYDFAENIFSLRFKKY